MAQCLTFNQEGRCPRAAVTWQSTGAVDMDGTPVRLPLCEQHEAKTRELDNAYAVTVAESAVMLAWLTGRYSA